MRVTHRTGLVAERTVASKRRIQELAVERFLADGFDHVTVEELAVASGVSPMSVYRWFGTKEGIVLWDEYDPPMLEEISRRCRRMEPLPAIRTALVDLLGEVYARDRALVLDRARLIHREPALLARALLDNRSFGAAIAQILSEHVDDVEADTLAAAAVASLTVAVDHWQREGARRDLAHHIDAVFAVLDGR